MQMLIKYQNLIKDYKKITKDSYESKHFSQDNIYRSFILDIESGDLTLNEIKIISKNIKDILIKDDLKDDTKGNRWYA